MTWNIFECLFLIYQVTLKELVYMTLIRLLTIVSSCMVISCIAQHQVKVVTRTVEIYHSDGSRQCEPESGISLTEMGKTLTNAGISILSSRRDHDCFFRPALCGSGAGAINVYEIDESRLSTAQGLGFIPYSRLLTRCGSR